MSETVKLYGINRLRKTLVVAESTRRSMQGNKSKDTKPEVLLRKAFWAKGVRGYRKNVRSLPGTPDLVFGRTKTAIFVHGCFWHGHDCGHARTPKQNREFWVEKVNRNRSRHDRYTASLKDRGYHVITIWECELKERKDEVVSRIQGVLASRA